MKPKRSHSEHCNGHMPSSAPLANPYVPYQMNNPPLYQIQHGLIRGTLYPGLDLPFQSNVNTKELYITPTTELQVLAFAIQDLALYLDTHRNDQEALNRYRAYQEMYQHSQEQYKDKYGQLNHMMYNTAEEYQWLDEPWPWEYAKNKGGV